LLFLGGCDVGVVDRTTDNGRLTAEGSLLRCVRQARQ
jgi:hypothetical protein